MKENLIKAVIIFGGGLGLFFLAKKKIENKVVGATSGNSGGKASADGGPAPDLKNAEIVADAYSGALKAGETPQRLTELNKELMKEFGMRCYVNDNVLTVCDSKGNTIMTK